MAVTDADLEALGRAADAAERYRRRIAVATQTPNEAYAAALARFSGPLPEASSDAVAVIDALVEAATPGLRAMTAPRFFGWVIGNSHPAGVAADWLTSAWGQNAANVVAAPAAAAAEAVAADWLLELLDLPRESSVGFVTGATVANFVALAAARSAVLARLGWDVEADGLYGSPEITVIIGEEAHITVFAALKYLGFGTRRLVTVPCDDEGAMRAAAFEQALKAVTGPAIVIGQAGQINSGAFDPFAEIAPLCRDAGAWLHVDGAFGLWARAAPERAHLARGVELADSWATDGHKWLQTPYDCGFAIVRDAEAHRRAMTIAASYLPPAAGSERDPSAYVPELSRRARGFSTWTMIKRLGRQGVAELVERDCRVAARMAERLGAEPGVRVANAVVLNQVVVRFGEDDDRTLSTVAEVQADAVAFMGAALWRGEWVMRISVSSDATTEAEADIAVDAVIQAWRRIRDRA